MSETLNAQDIAKKLQEQLTLTVTRSAPFCSVPSTPSRKATSAAPLAALWISP